MATRSKFGPPISIGSEYEVESNSGAPQFSPPKMGVPNTPVSRPAATPPDVGGGRSGVGRMQKAGLGSSVHNTVANSRPVVRPASTSGGYDGSGINPSANRPKPRPSARFKRPLGGRGGPLL